MASVTNNLHNVTTSSPYKELDHGYIRLLERIPTDGQLTFKMLHYHLEDLPEYAALSYRWGNGLSPSVILVNETPHTVTINLLDALNDLSHHQRTKYLWVDAICINQKDVLERNHQVKEMQRIYSLAADVYAYLGAEDNKSRAAMSFLKSYELSQDPAIGLAPLARDLVHVLFQREYFERLWIVPEFLNARNLLLFSGTQVLGWRSLYDWLLHFRKDSYDTAWLLCEDRARPLGTKDDSGEPLCNLRKLLHSYGKQQCADARDKVFALLALHRCPTGTRVRLQADYSASVSAVMWSAFCHIMESSSQDPSSLADVLHVFKDLVLSLNSPALAVRLRQTFHTFASSSSAQGLWSQVTHYPVHITLDCVLRLSSTSDNVSLFESTLEYLRPSNRFTHCYGCDSLPTTTLTQSSRGDSRYPAVDLSLDSNASARTISELPAASASEYAALLQNCDCSSTGDVLCEMSMAPLRTLLLHCRPEDMRMSVLLRPLKGTDKIQIIQITIFNRDSRFEYPFHERSIMRAEMNAGSVAMLDELSVSWGFY